MRALHFGSREAGVPQHAYALLMGLGREAGLADSKVGVVEGEQFKGILPVESGLGGELEPPLPAPLGQDSG